MTATDFKLNQQKDQSIKHVTVQELVELDKSNRLRTRKKEQQVSIHEVHMHTPNINRHGPHIHTQTDRIQINTTYCRLT